MRSRNPIRRAAALAVSASALSALSAIVPGTQAGVVNANWAGGDSADPLNWQEPTNWSTGAVPNNSGTNLAEATFLNTGLVAGNTVDVNGTISLAELLVGSTSSNTATVAFTLGNSQNGTGG